MEIVLQRSAQQRLDNPRVDDERFDQQHRCETGPSTGKRGASSASLPEVQACHEAVSGKWLVALVVMQ